jgi:hypothetical protein
MLHIKRDVQVMLVAQAGDGTGMLTDRFSPVDRLLKQVCVECGPFAAIQITEAVCRVCPLLRET